MPTIHHGKRRENYKGKRGLLNAEERTFVAEKRARDRNPRKPRKRKGRKRTPAQERSFTNNPIKYIQSDLKD